MSWVDERYLKSIFCAPEQNRAFTDRERRVMRTITEGRANKEIAAELGVSESAVKVCLQGMFNKTGVRTRSHLVRVAFEEGIQEQDSRDRTPV